MPKTPSGIRASSLSPAASTPPCIADASGPCASTPDSAPPPNPTSAIATCSIAARPASASLSICPHKLAWTPILPSALGEVGKVGVAIDSLDDMQTLLDWIPLDRVSTSMTINSTAAILLALYVAVAKQQGADLRRLAGTIQNDILKEYIARGTYIYPVRPAMRIVTDIFAWCAPKFPIGM